MGATLFATLFLINRFYGIRFYLIEAFIILNIAKDIVLDRMGFTFKDIGIKKIMILNMFLLAMVIVWHSFALR
jgi:hypothetical protein